MAVAPLQGPRVQQVLGGSLDAGSPCRPCCRRQEHGPRTGARDDMGWPTLRIQRPTADSQGKRHLEPGGQDLHQRYAGTPNPILRSVQRRQPGRRLGAAGPTEWAIEGGLNSTAP